MDLMGPSNQVRSEEEFAEAFLAIFPIFLIVSHGHYNAEPPRLPNTRKRK